MQIFEGLDSTGLKRIRRVLAVGAFDGVHRGHQRLLQHVCRTATEYDIESAIMTFEPIPAQVFRPEGALNVRLTTPGERRRELVRQCVQTGLILPFNADFRAISAEEFARDILVTRLGVEVLVASKTHTFGRHAEADVQRITELGMEYGFEVHVLPPILVDGALINSTDIRRALWAGNVELAASLLGRPYDLQGLVVAGRGLGHTFGFATANLQVDPQKLIPGDGVYACVACVRDEVRDMPGQWHAAAVSIGNTPTIAEGERLIEAHFIDAGDLELIGRHVQIAFLGHLRQQQKFDGIDELTAQIARDVQHVRMIIGALDNATRGALSDL